MGRLYLRIWFAVVATGIVGLVIGITATRILIDPPGQFSRALLGTISTEQVIATGAARDVELRLAQIAETSGLQIRVLGTSGEVMASSGKPIADTSSTDFVQELVLANGRRLQLLKPPDAVPGLDSVIASLTLVALGVALATYPIVRRITRRLERLKASVELLGAGKFDVQVDVQGNDEVATLAKTFNESARRIAQLVESNRSLLANASHELRSPLARVRMATELLAQKSAAADGPEVNEIRLSIRELDALIDEILTGSSLERVGFVEAPVATELAALVQQECARVGAQFHATPVILNVHPVLYRRMVRNLLENAVKYGLGRPVDVHLQAKDGRAELNVCDEGIGVPSSETERIFEPFYRRQGASEVSGGVGLGLSLAREIARKHGGDIDCRPNQPQGSVFCAWLPLQSNASTAR
ncbi:MAG: sensor histidine kinase [Burkholderiaceae bacterium]